MNICIFSWWERNYKIIYGLLVVCISAASLVLYFLNKSGDIGVVISVGYTLFLFIVTLSVSNEKTKFDNKFYLRLKRYIILKKINERFSFFNAETRNLKEMDSFIHLHRSFSKREPDESHTTKGWIISESWIVYSEKYKRTENEYIEAFNVICKLLIDEFISYFSTTALQQHPPVFQARQIDIMLASPLKYAQENLQFTSTELKKFEKHFLDFIKFHLSDVEDLSAKLNNIHSMNMEMVQDIRNTMGRIENIYGDRLQLELDNDSILTTNIDFIDTKISEISDYVASFEQSDNIISQLEEVSEKLQEIEDWITTNKP